MTTERKCACGIITVGIPAHARLHLSHDEFAGYYFECKCNSTIFIPLKVVLVDKKRLSNKK